MENNKEGRESCSQPDAGRITMATKSSTVVVIDKKEYNLSGFEEESYLQQVAAYINQKIIEMNQQDSYKRIPQDMKNLMLNLNLADDYFKAKEQAGNTGSKFTDLEKEIFDLKHQLVDAGMQLDDANAKLADADGKLALVKTQNEQMQSRIEELEKEKRELTQKNERLSADLEEVLLK
jgi:cell division protein ZapA